MARRICARCSKNCRNFTTGRRRFNPRSAPIFRVRSTWKNGGRCKSSNFAARDPGPQWTPAVSREKLDEILSVPVDMRAASNDLPAHAEISLQAVIRNFDSARQTEILQTKLRDLGTGAIREWLLNWPL